MTEIQSFHCPSCGAPLDIQGEARTLRCPYCNNSVIVPQALREADEQTSALGDIYLLLANNKKIEAIQLLREMTNLGLKEAKDYVEALERGQTAGRLVIHARGPAQVQTSAVDLGELMDLTRQGQKMEAIKRLRQSTGLGLKESLEVVEALERGDSPEAANELMQAMLSSGFNQSAVTVSTTTLDARKVTKAATAVGAGASITGCMILVVVLAAIFVPIFFALASSGGPLAPLWSKLNPLAFASIDLTLKGEGIAPGQFNDPRTVAVDREGGFYAGDFNTGRVQAFDAQGNFRWVANLGDEVIIESMDVSPTGILFIAAQGEIRRFQASDGRELDPLPKPDPQSYYYEDLAFGPDGRLAVIANGEDLYIFNPDLQLVISVPEAISSITQDSELDSDVAMDGMGNIYLLGTFNYKVLRYTPDGRYVNQFGGDTVDEAPGKFRAPGEIAVDNQGRVYVSDIFGIQVFDGDGQYINRFDLVQYAFGMDFDLENRMYIASNEPQVVRLVLRK